MRKKADKFNKYIFFNNLGQELLRENGGRVEGTRENPGKCTKVQRYKNGKQYFSSSEREVDESELEFERVEKREDKGFKNGGADSELQGVESGMKGKDDEDDSGPVGFSERIDPSG